MNQSAAGLATRVVEVVLVLALGATVAAAQGRLTGTTKDETGQPVKGVSIVAENPDAAPQRRTATTDAKGRFAMIGLSSGTWVVVAQAPGFEPAAMRAMVRGTSAQTPVDFRMVKATLVPVGALDGVHSRALGGELDAADALLDGGDHAAALAAYEGILAKVPALTLVNLQIARAARLGGDTDRAVAACQAVLAKDPANDRARVELGLAYLARHDLDQADAALTAAAEAPAASREALFAAGQVKAAKNRPDDAAAWYERAAQLDPAWSKPLVELGLLAADRGDRDAALRYLQAAIARGPDTPDAARARALLERLK